MTLKVVDAKANPDDVLVHDETNRTLAQLAAHDGAARVPGCARCRAAPARVSASRRRTTRLSRRSSRAPAGLRTCCARRALGTSRRSESFDGGRERRALARRAQRRSRAPRTSLPRHAKTPSMGLGGAHPCAPTVSGGHSRRAAAPPRTRTVGARVLVLALGLGKTRSVTGARLRTGATLRASSCCVSWWRLSAGEVGGDAFCSAPDAKEVAAPDLRDVRLAVAAGLELGGHVAGLGCVVPTDDRRRRRSPS